MYTYGRFMLLHGKNHHNIIKYYKLKIKYKFYRMVINTQNTKKKKKIGIFPSALPSLAGCLSSKKPPVMV